jgi:polyhydroxybutyrate depolymerase
MMIRLFLSLFIASSAQASFFDFFSSDRVVTVGQHDPARPDAKLYLPEKDSSLPRPLIVLLHGYSSSADRTSEYFKIKSEINKRDFLILSPQGRSDSRGYAFWNATDFCCDLDKTSPNDVQYLLDLVADVRSKYAIDAQRIYLVGHSNGGFMANRLACEAPNLFAGLVSLAGGDFKNPNDCAHAQPISLLQIHGVDDPTISFPDVEAYAGGEETLRRRAVTNHCQPNATPTGRLDLVVPMAGLDTDIFEWQGCSDQTEVQLWRISPYTGKPGAPHKPAFTKQLAPRLLDWLLKQKRVN